MHRRLGLALSLILIAAAVATVQVSTAPALPPATLTIAHFNDVYEIDAVENGNAGGLARLATALDKVRRGPAPVITTLGGDFLSPSALGTAVVSGEALAGKQMVDVLNSVGLQWATLGNHEFDLSEAAFHKRLAEAKFKIVVSNVTDGAGKPFVETIPSAVVRVRSNTRTLRIGLIGLVIDQTKKPWVRYQPSIDSARAEISKLQGKVDAIVALTHLTLLEDQALVEAVPEIDLVLGGHEHENWMVRRGTRFTPIVKADANVRSLAVVTMNFPSAGRPAVSARFEILDRRIALQPRTQALVKKWVDTAYEAFRHDGFDPAAVITTLPEPFDGRELVVRHRAGNLTSLIVDAMRNETNADAAILNGGSIRIDDVLPAGPVRQYDIIRVLPFGGKVLKVTMDGALLRQVLEAGIANLGSGGFLHWSRISHENGTWIVNGQPLRDDAVYTIGMPEFLMTGQESRMGFLTRDKARGIEELRDVRLVLIDELKRRFGAPKVQPSDLLAHSLQRVSRVAR